jgi:microcystin-dependent protein
MMGCTFAPYGWAFCDGSLQSIAENAALYNLIGTIYGGDGVNTFALPDLRGRVPIHIGSTPSTGTYTSGERAGVEQVTLTSQQTAAHNHVVNATTTGQRSAPSTQAFPASTTPANSNIYGPPGTSATQMYGGIVVAGGGSNLPHENRQPYLAVNFVIALFGAYPSQN